MEFLILRTNWKFGALNINVLVIAVISFPLMFKLLPKAGNSNTKECIELIERFICLFGTQALGCLTAFVPRQINIQIPVLVFLKSVSSKVKLPPCVYLVYTLCVPCVYLVCSRTHKLYIL